MQNYRNGGMGMQPDNGGGFGGQQRGGGIGQASPGGMTDGIIGQTMGGPNGGFDASMGGMPMRGMNPANNFGAGQRPDQFTDAMARYQMQCSGGDGYACQKLQQMQQQNQQQQSNWGDQYNQGRQQYGAINPGGSMGQNKWG